MIGSRRLLACLITTILSASSVTALSDTVSAAENIPSCERDAITNTANYESDLIYQVLVDRFYDGDPSNNNPKNISNTYDSAHKDINKYFGGDWKGLILKLPYLQHLGVGAIWITPPYDNMDQAYSDGGSDYAAYHGYWGKDYFVPDEHWGSWKEFDALVNSAHSHGIKVMIDFAPNHTNHTDSAIKGAFYRNGTLVGSYGDGQGLFHEKGNRPDNDTSMWAFQNQDLAKLADLSSENPTVQRYMLDAIDVWLDHGVDGVRNDATLHQSKAFRSVFASHVNSKKPVFQVGEYFISTPDPKYDDYKSSPEETGINILDFEFANVARDVFGSFSRNMYDLKNMLEQTEKDYWNVNDSVTWLDSHDKKRLGSLQPNKGIFHVALAFLMTSRGTPTIYYGTEQYIAGDNADAGRQYMTEFNESSDAYKLISDLAGLRKDNLALRYGKTKVRWQNENVIIYERVFGTDTVMVALNRSGETYRIDGLKTNLVDGQYADYLEHRHSGGSIEVLNGHVEPFDLGPAEIGVWSYKGQSPAPLIGAVGSSVASPGDEVTIDGINFGSIPGNIKIGGSTPDLVCWSDGQIRVNVPSGVSGVLPILLNTADNKTAVNKIKVRSGELVQQIFHIDVQTDPGDEIYIAGNVPELGSFDPDKAIGPLFKADGRHWYLPVAVPANQRVAFKFIKKDVNGNIYWEGGEDRLIYTPNASIGSQDSEHYQWKFN